jgi:hypothetical protein
MLSALRGKYSLKNNFDGADVMNIAFVSFFALLEA